MARIQCVRVCDITLTGTTYTPLGWHQQTHVLQQQSSWELQACPGQAFSSALPFPAWFSLPPSPLLPDQAALFLLPSPVADDVDVRSPLDFPV